MVVRNLEYYKERYNRMIEKYDKGIKQEDKESWYGKVCLMEERVLEGWNWLLHDFSQECLKAEEISDKFSKLGYWGGRKVDVRQIDERAGIIYPDLILGLKKEFDEYNENLSK
jgi:hypothetical protein